MVFFYLLLFLSIILAFVVNRQTKVGMAWLPFLIMLLLCGLRGDKVGTDTETYLLHFFYGTNERHEVLYRLTVEACHFFRLTAHQFIFVTALLTFGPLYVFVRKYSVNPCFSALIYITFSAMFFGLTFNGVRQSIAMSFSLFSVYYLSQKNIIRSFIFLVVATLFHYSCLVILPFLIAFYFVHSISKRALYIVLIGSFCFGLLFGQSGYFLQFFQYLEIFSDNEIARNYLHYADERNIASLNIIGILSRMLPFMLYSFLLYDSKNKSSLAYMFIVTGAVFSNVFISVHYVFRLTAYYILPILFVLPETQDRVKGIRYTAICSLNTFMILWYFYELLKAGPESLNGIFPYSTCL